MAQNTKDIPSPQANNALEVSYGIAEIPAYQKRDSRATHYLEIVLKLITEDKGIRIFVPNLAVGETYWVVFELAIPEQPSDLGKAKVQYFDMFARQNKKPQFDLSPKSQIASQLVAQHGLGLWTSEVVYYALADFYSHDLETAEERIRYHISRLEMVKMEVASKELKELVGDDIITLRKFLSLSQNLGKVGRVSDNPQAIKAYFVHGLNALGRARDGYKMSIR